MLKDHTIQWVAPSPLWATAASSPSPSVRLILIERSSMFRIRRIRVVSGCSAIGSARPEPERWVLTDKGLQFLFAEMSPRQVTEDLVRVLELDELEGPLDIGEAAPAQLGVRAGIRAAWQPFGVHSGLDPPDLQDLFPGRPARREADAVGQLHEPGAELRIAGHVPGPQQRLRFPDLRPTRVVLLVRGETADQQRGSGNDKEREGHLAGEQESAKPRAPWDDGAAAGRECGVGADGAPRRGQPEE